MKPRLRRTRTMTMTTMMMMMTRTRIERGISLSGRAKRAAAALAEARNPVLAVMGGRAQHRFGDAGVAEALDLRPTQERAPRFAYITRIKLGWPRAYRPQGCFRWPLRLAADGRFCRRQRRF